MKNLKVRQAIEYGINKVAVQKAEGGPAVDKVINTAIPPGNVGYAARQPVPEQQRPGRHRQVQVDAGRCGLPEGRLADLPVRERQRQPRIFAAIQASLKPCGVNLVGKPEPGSSFFVDLGNSPVNNKAGTWDMGQPGWIADWCGPNGRTIMDPLFKTRCVVNTNNYGCLSDQALDKAIEAGRGRTAVAVGRAVGQGGQHRHAGRRDRAAGGRGLPGYSSARVQNAGSSAVVYRAEHRHARHHQRLAQPEQALAELGRAVRPGYATRIPGRTAVQGTDILTNANIVNYVTARTMHVQQPSKADPAAMANLWRNT